MPAWGRALTPAQIWKIVAYIESKGGAFPAALADRGRQGDLGDNRTRPRAARSRGATMCTDWRRRGRAGRRVARSRRGRSSCSRRATGPRRTSTPPARAGRSEATLGWWLTRRRASSCCSCASPSCSASSRHRDDDAAWRRRGRERNEIKSGLNWIYIGVALTIVVLIVTFAGTMVTLNAASHPPHHAVAHAGRHGASVVVGGDATARPAHPELGFTTANEVHLPGRRAGARAAAQRRTSSTASGCRRSRERRT